MTIPTPAQLRGARRLPLALAAVTAFALTGCDHCWFHKKKNNNNELLLLAARQNGSSAGGVAGGGGGGTGATSGGGGGSGRGGGGAVPEVHAGAAAGVLTLLAGTWLILFDRRRRFAGPLACN